MTFRIVPRSEWGATAGRGPRMLLPVGTLYLHHTVTTPTGDPYADMRTVERIGRQRFGIFSYSYAVHPDGTCMEGAGDTRGAHTGGHNSTSLAVVLIGNYETSRPTDAQIATVGQLRGDLVARRRLTAGHRFRPHRAVKQTACPGRHAVDAMHLMTPDSPVEEDPDMHIRDALKFAQGSTGPVYLLNVEDGTRKGVPTHEARLGLAEAFKIDPDVNRVHNDVIAMFREAS